MTPAQATVLVSHQFYAPSPLLSPFVAAYWLHQSAPQTRSRVVPTGTAQLILDLSGDGLSVPGDSSTGADRPRAARDRFPALLHGTDTAPFLLETDRPLFQVGVDFKPGGAYPFFAPPAHMLQNAHLSLDALWTRRQVMALCEQAAASRTLEECVHLLEQALLRQLVRPLCHHPAVALALRVLSGPVGPSVAPLTEAKTLDAAPAPIRIWQVAQDAGFSAGRLTRLFQEEVGLSPKQFARVRRFRTMLRRLRTESSQLSTQRVHWARLAVECGYYDQAHLIKEFQSFAGVSPTSYLQARTARSPFTLLIAD